LPNDQGIRAFEVDAPKTQAVKCHVLEKCGFDPSRRALFLWEGVTMYLDRAAIEATLRKISSTAKGSVVAFDSFTTEALTSRALDWRYGRLTTKAAKEALRFGVDSSPPSSVR
jgi:O-methyltransferase involved in polyketide biosynthesis